MASLLANGISLFSPQSSIETSKPLKGFVPRIETLKTQTSHFPNSSRLFKIRANVGKTIPSDQTSLTVFQSPRPTGTWSNRIGTSLRCFSALTPELKTNLDKVVTSNKVVLFMKGTKDFPQCGFSNTCVQILKSLNVPFETLNILENELLRQALKEYSNWPTFPQLYIDGEFFGGCDITVESYKTGELQEVLEKAMCS